MKFVRFRTPRGRIGWGWLDETQTGGVAEPFGRLGALNLIDVLAGEAGEMETICRQAETHVHDLASLHLLAPIARPGKIIAVGRNYVGHASELGNAVPEAPMLFGIMPSAVTGPYDEIEMPEASTSTQIDWEGELGVVIGRTARNVKRADAEQVIAGYTVVNDVSARDLQRKDQQWTRAKSFDTFKPMGPYLVTTAELGLARDLKISVKVNGTQKQSSSTSLMVHKVDDLIEYISAFCTLEPGDVIATGTPAGVGMGENPPGFLKPGDLVETEIEGIGRMANRTVAWQPAAVRAKEPTLA